MITTMHDRHEHLRRQIAGLRRSSWSADMHVVVALADPMIRGVVARTNSPAVVADCDYANGQLPVAQGRNIGARPTRESRRLRRRTAADVASSHAESRRQLCA